MGIWFVSEGRACMNMFHLQLLYQEKKGRERQGVAGFRSENEMCEFTDDASLSQSVVVELTLPNKRFESKMLSENHRA